MNHNIEQDTKIMKAIKASEIRHLIAHTNLGTLEYKLTFGEDSYEIFLDSTPIEPEVADKLIRILEQE